jgi:two-component system nitrogen regulation sensor histidine kinase NtrY
LHCGFVLARFSFILQASKIMMAKKITATYNRLRLKRLAFRYGLAAAVLLLLIGILQIAWSVSTNRVESGWADYAANKLDKVRQQALTAFGEYQTGVLRSAEQVAQSKKNKVPLGKMLIEKKFTDVFTALRDADVPEMHNLTIYDADGTMVAWLHRTTSVYERQIKQALAGQKFSAICSEEIYTDLVVFYPIASPDDSSKIVGVAVAAAPLAVNYTFNTRYLRSGSLAQTISKQLDYAIELDFLSDTLSFASDRFNRYDINDLSGKPLCSLIVSRPVMQTELEVLDYGFAAFLNLVLTLLLGVVAAFLFHAFIMPMREPFILKLGLEAALLLLLRYVIFLIGFPAGQVKTEMFDPTVFTSTFGFGIAESIGELSISSLFLLCISGLIFFQTIKHLQQKSALPSRHWSLLILKLLLLNAVFIALVRSSGAIIRSFVVDSSIEYINPFSIFSGYPQDVMNANIFAVTLCVLSLAALMIVVSQFLIGHYVKSVAARWLVATGLMGVSLLMFLRTEHGASQVIWVWNGVLIFTAVGGMSFFIYRNLVTQKKNISIFDLVATALLCVAVSYPLLFANIQEQKIQNLQQTARRFVIQEDAFAKEVIAQSLAPIDEEAQLRRSLLEATSGSSADAAFALWANTIVSREDFDCIVRVYDSEKNLVSAFQIGSPRLWSKALQRLSLGAEILDVDTVFIADKSVTVLDAGKPRRLYMGVDAVNDEDRRKIGTVMILLLSRNFSVGQPQLELLTSYDQIRNDNFLYAYSSAEFKGSNLVSSSGGFFDTANLPDSIAVQLRQKPLLSFHEETEDDIFETVYAKDPKDANHTVAFRIKHIDAKWHAFNFLKFSLLGFLILFAAYICYVAGAMIRAKRIDSGFRLSFRDKLYAAFLFSSVVPILLLGFYSRQLVTDSNQETLEQNLVKDLDTILATLTKDHVERKLPFTDAYCQSLSQTLKIDFAVFKDGWLEASSRNELYQTELLDRRINASAYQKIFLENRNFSFEKEIIGNYAYLVGYRPYRDSSGKIEFVVSVPAFYRQKSVALETAVARAYIFTLYGLVIALASVIVNLFSRAISSPITELRNAMSQVSLVRPNREVGPYISRFSSVTKDEIGDLIDSYNKMLTDLESSKTEVTRMERELAWREMARQIAHEIKNPLTPLKLNTQLLRQAHADKNENFDSLFDKVTTTIINQVDALSRIATEFSNFAKLPKRTLANIDVRQILNETVMLMSGDGSVKVMVELPNEPLTVMADTEELRRVYINLVKNAMQSFITQPTQTDKVIVIKASRENGSVISSVSDNGAGISEAAAAKLFQPNFSTKTDGMGLGLAICKRIIDELGGRIDYKTTAGLGTTFVVTLPAEMEQAG